MKPDEQTNHPAILEQLRAVARRGTRRTTTPVDATDYDWTRPRHFTAAQHDRLAALAKRLSTRLGEAMTAAMRVEIAFEAAEVVERYADSVSPDDQNVYYVPLRDPAGEPCGMVCLPAAVAVGWIENLLGDSGSTEGEDGELSSLETALLLDIVAAMVKTASAASRQDGGPAFQHDAALTSLEEALPHRDGDELCCFSFRLAGDQDNVQFTFFMRSDFLESVADPTRRHKAAPSSEETRARILNCIRAAPVTVAAQLGTVAVSFRDLVSLEPGDVVVLQSRVGETIGLAVDEQVVLRGIPAVCKGRYAVQVQDRRRYPRLERQV
ncbi:hypothetical protein ES703_57561 [subsurface metagenome]